MAEVQEAPQAPHSIVPPGMAAEEDKPRIQLNIDWSNVDLDSIVLPPGDDMGIKRYVLTTDFIFLDVLGPGTNFYNIIATVHVLGIGHAQL